MDILQEFTFALLKLADRRTIETGGTYVPIEFRQMVEALGGVETAKKLIHAPISTDLIELKKIGRPDLTLEGFIVQTPQYHGLFTDEELDICRIRAEIAASN